MKKIIQKTLLFLLIVKETKNKNGGINIRLNKWNPLSYIFLLLLIIIAFFIFGIIGIKDEIFATNPFRDFL